MHGKHGKVAHRLRRLLAAGRAAFAAMLAAAVAGCTASVVGESGAARLAALEVTGAAAPPYPGFDAGVLHYAVRCAAGTALQVTARAQERDAALRLLHNGRTATGTIQAAMPGLSMFWTAALRRRSRSPRW